MIATVETRIVERLREGLGDIVASIGSYGGELDDNVFDSIRVLPAIWVTYGGSSRIEVANTARSRFRETHQFITMIAVRSVRSEEAQRLGGTDLYEVGSYQLIRAVKYLLTNQTLGGIVHKGLTPRNIRTLHNHTMTMEGALSVFAVEWEVLLDEFSQLEDGRFPIETDDPNHPDHWFNEFKRNALSPEYPDLLSIYGKVQNTEPTEESVSFITKLGDNNAES
ncbi:phage protein Gp37 [Wohlfahrtiimonas larvae]|uniref:DUF1834 family protein n=1 Tax=Wohlfahrtiimonas larvae TaxID=1157986 RepID=A0ABP9MXT6_9GAMM|nr:phage protein Gp37 [Wohlfahrtiimonas larvae]